MIILYSVFVTLALLAFTVGSYLYVQRLLRDLNFLVENIDNLRNSVDEYLEHLEYLYSLETFRGDDTIKHLLDSTQILKEEIDEYKHFCSMLYGEDFDGEEEEETTQEEDKQ